ncbi:MAG TPA: 16S rRNA (adenine(1518)-N(6)/adenine(1519)-N(6))-dimethyltransferase RsmA [Microvirga sp.]|nr:16S rRNA (adenine(1518)-N(6)/adenine(1519)-N(6))-dimethyltransferase RsmA [Microvirga sp.]
MDEDRAATPAARAARDDERPADGPAADADHALGLPGLSPNASPSRLLRQLGLRPRKRFSQSFLVDRRVPEAIVKAADVGPDDRVLEIGPGLGIMTRVLARKAHDVVAVELDRDLAEALPRLVPDNVEIVQGDALEFDPASRFGGPYKLVANLPYAITSPFLFRYLDIRPAPAPIVVMIQREVAERIAARPGALSYLAVAVKSVATVRLVRHVPPGAFHPRPKVESAVIRLDPRHEPLVPPEDRARFLELVRAGFAQPRKTVANSLAQGLGVERAVAVARLERVGIAPERRPHELSLEEWRTLFEADQGTDSARPPGPA